MNTKLWYALRVPPSREERASTELSHRGFETFLPTQKVKRRWSDRIKVLDSPLFPGYVFSRFAFEERVIALRSPWVIQIVGAAGRPIAVSDDEITAVRALVASRLVVTPWPYLRVGHKVRIANGPLTGLDGVVVRAADGSPRIVVSVDLLQRSVAAEVDRSWLALAS